VKISVASFKGEAPILADRLLPEGMASKAVNARMVSGDLDSYTDIGNPFQLAKAPVINAIWLMQGPAPDYWLQFNGSDLAYGSNVDVSLGTIPGDTTNRTFITGLAGGPQQTNLFYATDPSQQGSSAAGGYPYVTFPLGLNSPAAVPLVTAPSQPAGPTTTYQFAQEASVNSANIVAGGSGYVVGDTPGIGGGTLAPGFTTADGAAQLTVSSVDASGAITGVTLQTPGLYQNGLGPGCTSINQSGLSLPAATISLASTAGLPQAGSVAVTSSAGVQTVAYAGISGNSLTGCSGGSGTVANGAAVQSATVVLTGGSGSGATVAVNDVPNSFTGFGAYDVNNGAGYYISWALNGPYWWVSSGQGDLTVAYSQASFALKSCGMFTMQADMADAQSISGQGTDLVMYLCGTYGGAEAINGPIVVLSSTDGTFTLYSQYAGSNGNAVSGTIVSQKSGLTIAGNTFYRVKAVCTAETASTTPGYNVTVTLAEQASAGTVMASLSGFIPYGGESLGLGTNHRNNHNDGGDGFFENIVITVSQPADSVTSESTSYVYTYVSTKGTGANSITEESGPSDPSPTITIYFDTTSNPISLAPISGSIPACPAGQYITNYNLYRLTRLSDGSEVYELDQTLAASSTAAVPWTDTVLDEDLGDALLSSDWVPPPANLQGILALPNGIMAGFFGNTLCLSAQSYPFAWPVGNQLPTDAPIVAIAAIDSTVLVLTTAHPYTAYGSDPAAFQMSKETANQGCMSKRSVVTHKRLGVVYAGGNGPCYYRGQGVLDLIRMAGGDPYFSVEQWQALNPASIIAVVHDDRYWFWYQNSSGKGGYVLDLSPAGFGLVQLDFHVTAAYVDPSSDTLYFIPDFSQYPINGNMIGSALDVLSQWEGGSGVRARSWERDGILLPRPACFGQARVRAEDYSSITLTVDCENGTAYSGPVSGAQPFVMAPVVGTRWSIGLSGASTVNTVEVVEDGEEMGQ
jgi:hypothetical protein